MDQTLKSDQAFSKLNVAVVDDNAALRGAVRTVLTSFGCKQVLEAENAHAAINLVKSGQIDLIIVDWKMRPIDGLSLVKKLRDRDESPDPYIPIIMLTAYDDRAHRQEAHDAGVNGFLPKPFDAARLYEAMAEVINNPRYYVRTSDFFGPDRRFEDSRFIGPERRDAITA